MIDEIISTKYPKINSIFKRDKETKHFIINDWARYEFEVLKNIDWLWTEKIDGTNIRIVWNAGVLSFAGRTDNAQIPIHLLSHLQKLFPIEKFREKFPDTDVIFYGEGFGYKINKGCKYFNGNKEVDFILFDVNINNIWLEYHNVKDIANQFSIQVVPIISKGTIDEAITLVKNGFISIFGNFVAEGVVIIPLVPLLCRDGRRIITKIKHVDFQHLK